MALDRVLTTLLVSTQDISLTSPQLLERVHHALVLNVALVNFIFFFLCFQRRHDFCLVRECWHKSRCRPGYFHVLVCIASLVFGLIFFSVLGKSVTSY